MDDTPASVPVIVDFSIWGTLAVTTTMRVISYTCDPLNRLPGAICSSGETYAYDAVGNRTAMADTTTVHAGLHPIARRVC